MLKHSIRLMLAAAMVLVLGAVVRAEDPKPAGATGTWKWTTQGRDGQPRDTVLKIKVDGEKVTGTITGFNNQEVEIKEGALKDGALTFNTSVTRNEQTFTTKYSAKIDGDTIKGKSERERDGQVQTREFEGKRVKEEPKPAAQ